MAPTPYSPPDGHIICRLSQVTEGWEYRFTADGKAWHTSPHPSSDSTIVEARPVRQPDPKWLRTDATVCQSMTWAGDDGRMCGVTTVGEMRERTDLDQWEYANMTGLWQPASHWRTPGIPDDFPVIVRRKKDDR